MEDCTLVTSVHLSTIEKLTVKGITSNEIDLLDKAYGSYFSILEELDISDSPQMLKIPDFIYYIPKLKKLNISMTGIHYFDEKMCQMKKLITLLASHNSYDEQKIPMNVFCLDNLRVLDMSYSSLRHIDEEIYYLKTLEELYLRNNNFIALPVLLHIMPTLLVLDLRESENQMVSVFYDCKSIVDNLEERGEMPETIVRISKM